MNPFITTHPDFIYARLMAITWHANYVLAPAMFTSAAGDKLRQCIESDSSNKPVVLNCAGISTIVDHALGTIRGYLTTSNKCIVFVVDAWNMELIEKICHELGHAKSLIKQTGNSQLLFFGRSEELFKPLMEILNNLLERTHQAERDFIAEAVGKCYEPCETKRLSSTPLIAKGEFNARALISDPKVFSWTSLLLTDLFIETLKQAKPRTNRLLAVSLRGSPFAAAIRILSENFSPSLEIIDHIGPRHELLESHIGPNNMDGGEYVLVSDFVIGGTEIKIARTYAMAHGACLENAIAIGSYLPGDQYDRNVCLRSIVSLAAKDTPDHRRYEFYAGEIKP